MKEKTCDELIEAKLASRLGELMPDFDSMSCHECARFIREYGGPVSEHFNDDSRLSNEENFRNAARDCYNEFSGEEVLSIDASTTYKVLLSCGGPEDFFELYHSKEYGWEGGEYVYKDWFDNARRSINAIIAEQLAELWCIYPEDQ